VDHEVADLGVIDNRLISTSSASAYAPGSPRLSGAVTGIDADTTLAGDQAFRFVGTTALSATPGEVGWYSSGGNTIIRGSIDADVQAEFEIQLNGIVSLSAADFYL
jgi:hypothetical protein